MQVSKQTYRSTRKNISFILKSFKNFHENLNNELWSMQYEIYCHIISTFFIPVPA